MFFSLIIFFTILYGNVHRKGIPQNNLSKVEPLDDNLRRTIELYDTSNLGQLIERLKLAGLKEELDLFDQVKDFQKLCLILIYFTKSVLKCQENSDFQSFKSP